MTERRRIGDIGVKDVWTLVFRGIGMMLFPVLLLMPLVVVWRIFFYEPEDFWQVVRWGFIYVAIVTAWVWLTSCKTVFECDGSTLVVIKKRCLLWESGQKRISISEIKQITFAEMKGTRKKTATFEKVFRLKFVYHLIYKLSRLLLNKGKMNVCIIYGEQRETLTINDIKKNGERYQFLKNLQTKLETRNER